MIGVLLILARGEGQKAMICFVLEACKGRLHRLHEQGMQAISKQMLLFNSCSAVSAI
jgi:hypothetical protein